MDINKFKTTTLYFTAGMVATDIELAEAQEVARVHATTVRVRNGSAPITGGLEKCDYVAGPAIPGAYLMKYPKVGEANETPQEAQSETLNPGNEGGTAATGQGAQSSASPLASEVGSVTGGWGSSS
jgi:hypothetical protein